jgi:hypothetical protein
MATKPKANGKWNIRCLYYDHKKEVIRTIAARYPRSAITHAVDHMQMDHYNAEVAEIIDQAIGTLHAVLSRTPREVKILYRREADAWRSTK